jgi:hypothetical protein
MNDGEMNMVVKNKGTASRGYQDYAEDLSVSLYQALTYKAENYFVGVPCSACYPSLARYINNPENYLLANLLINSNFQKSYNLFEKIFKERRVVMVCNEKADLTDLSFSPYIVFRVPEKNAWDRFSKLKEGYRVCQDGDIALFCCGPLGRVLCYEWYKNNPRLTCLELGSFYDPWTMKKAYMYQTGILPICNSCNPEVEYNEEIIESIIDRCQYLERYFFNDTSIQSMNNIYRNKTTIRRFYKVALKNIGYGIKLSFYYEWMITIIELENGKKSDIEYLRYKIEYFLNKYPNRSEAVYDLVINLPERVERLEYLGIIQKIKRPENEEYVDDSVYSWKILDTLVVDSYYIGDYSGSYSYWEKLMQNIDKIPEHYRHRCIDNGRYAKMILDEKK